MPATDDYVTQAVQALAGVLNTYVADLGYVFDTDDQNPSPDVVSPALVGQYADTGPVVSFGGPETFDFARSGSTMGQLGRIADGYVVIVTLTFGYWDNYRTTYASRARVYVYRIRKAIREHNVLGVPNQFMWKAKPLAGQAGWLPDPEQNRRYVVQIPVDLEFEYTITAGS